VKPFGIGLASLPQKPFDFPGEDELKISWGEQGRELENREGTKNRVDQNDMPNEI
jgi:hypothetical protein